MRGDGRVEGEGETDFTGDVMHLLAAMLEGPVRVNAGQNLQRIDQFITDPDRPPTIEHHPPIHHP